MLMICSIALAGPDLSGYSFKDTSTGETYDFYSDKVVYYAPGAPNSRRGDYSIGRGVATSRSASANVSAPISIQIYIGDRTVTISGTITYNRMTNRPISLVLNGRQLTNLGN